MRTLLTSAVALLIGIGTAHATIIFSPTNSPSGSEQTIQFESPITGLSITGDTNQTNSPVIFDTTFAKGVGSLGGAGTDQEIIGQGLGQSHITCTTGGTACTNNGGNQSVQLNSLEMKPGNNTAWTDVVANPDFGTGTMNVFVQDNLGNNFDFTLGNGQNFFTLNASGGEVITDVQMTMSAGGGWNDFQQPRVSGVCTLVGTTCTPIATPEPGTLVLLGTAILGFGVGHHWMRRRRDDDNGCRAA
jgi:hypothetical protein